MLESDRVIVEDGIKFMLFLSILREISVSCKNGKATSDELEYKSSVGKVLAIATISSISTFSRDDDAEVVVDLEK